MNLMVLCIAAAAWGLGVLPGPLDSLWPLAGVVSLFVLSDVWGASRWCQQLCLAIVGGLLALSFADAGVRVAGFQRWYYRPEELLLEHSPQWRTSYRFRPRQSLQMKTWGDLSNLACDPGAREPRHVSFQTDALGFRNTANAATYDTILLGDSYTYGSGTTQSGTWTEELRRQGVGAYNVGMPSNPVQAVANYLHTRETIPHAAIKDVVYVLFEGNDFDWEQSIDPYSPLVALGMVERWGNAVFQFQAASPLRRFAQALRGGCPTAEAVFRRQLSPGGELLFYRPYDNATRITTTELAGSPGWAVAAAAIRMLAKSVAEQPGVRLHVVLVPTKEHVYIYPDAPAAAAPLLSALGEELSVPVTDATPTFIEEARRLLVTKGELLWWRDDTHWNPAGHQVMAGVVLSDLAHRIAGAE